MNPYILFKISGLKGVFVSEDITEFSPVNDDQVSTIHIEQNEDKVITGLRFTMKENIHINDDLVFDLHKRAEILLVNLSYKLYLPLSNLELALSQVYKPNEQGGAALTLHDTMFISSTISITQGYRVNVFTELYNQNSSRPDAEDLYTLLFNTMKIDNPIIRYFMQYELLMTMVAPDRTQKEIGEYIKSRYNPLNPQNQIGFTPTRKAGRTYDEDEITFCRNALGHNDSSFAVGNDTIKRACFLLTQVLYFALYN